LGLIEDLSALFIVGNNTFHHTNGLRERTKFIVIRESILLQELVFDDLSDLKSSLLILTKRIFTYKLHNFCQISLFLQDEFNGFFVRHEIGFSFTEIIEKHGIVVGIRDSPVDGWEMLSLGKLFVQSPEHLDDIKCGSGNWIREITTWWRHSTDDRDRTLSSWLSFTVNSTSSLVERGELRTQVSGETGICWHFSKTSRDLSESFGPTRGRISHHCNIETHISEVLS